MTRMRDACTVYTYGPSGRVLGAFTIQAYTTSTGASFGVAAGGNYGYFGGRLLNVQDRVGDRRGRDSRSFRMARRRRVFLQPTG